MEYKRMVQTLEQYVAQATNAYKPTQTAIQNQIDALAGQLEATNEQINKNYAQQQAGLNRQRNMAAETASMQAAGSGGSFGGAANLANRRYYDQTFVPAVTQMRTNQTNELAQARQASEDRRLNYGMQKANYDAQANQQALAQYYNDLAAEQQRQFQAEEAEKDRQAQLKAQQAQAAAQNAYYQYLMEAMKAQQSPATKQQTSFQDWIRDYSDMDDNSKSYWIDSINKISSQSGPAGQVLASALSSRLQNTPQYKQYLNWRNS